MKKLFGLAALLLFPTASLAACPGWLKPDRWEFRTGYGYQYTNNSRPHHFDMVHFLPSAAVPIRETGDSAPAWMRGRLEWAPELFLALFTHPYVRPVIGVTPLQFRYVFETKCRLHPYLFAGAGFLYAHINRRETRSDWNFNPQGGAGLYYALNGAVSLILEYRHLHISNSGLHEDNAGLNAHTFLAGVSFKR